MCNSNYDDIIRILIIIRKWQQRAMEDIEIKFKDNATTADKLIKATRVLISKYGYEATTTRMIANLAKVNLSAISFHFGNKENLVREAMIKSSEKLSEYYCALSDEIRIFLREDSANKEKAWEYLDAYLSDRIRRMFDEKSWINIGLISHEHDLPESSRGIVAETLIRDNEQVLAELILAVCNKKDKFRAALVARMISAAIISYIEKPLLNQHMETAMEIDLQDVKAVGNAMHEYFMQSIRAIAA